MEANPHERPNDQGHNGPPVSPWRSAAIGAVLGSITLSYYLNQPFGMGGDNLHDGIHFIVGALLGGYIGYLLPNMRLTPFSR